MGQQIGVIGTAFCLIIFCLIVLTPLYFIDKAFSSWEYNKNEAITKCQRTELVSVKIGSKISGSLDGSVFLLFGGISGSINEGIVYNFYAKNKDGSYVLSQRPGGTPVFEDEKENPYLLECGPNRPKIEFHVPPNSVVSDYQLSL